MLNKLIDELNGQVSSEIILLVGGILIIVLVTIIFYKNYMVNVYHNLNSTEFQDLNQSINRLNGKFKSF